MSDLNEVIRRAKRRGGRLVPWRMCPDWAGSGMYHFRDGSLLVRGGNALNSHMLRLPRMPAGLSVRAAQRGSLLVAALLT